MGNNQTDAEFLDALSATHNDATPVINADNNNVSDTEFLDSLEPSRDSNVAPAKQSVAKENLPEILGVPYDIEAPLRLLDIPSDIAANLGSVMAEDDYTIGDAIDRVLADIAGETDQSKAGENYDTALKLVDSKLGRGAVHIAGFLQYLAALPPSVTSGAAKAIKGALMRGSSEASRALNKELLYSATTSIEKASQTVVDAAVVIGGKSITPIRKIGTPTSHRMAARLGDDVGQGSGIQSMELGVYQRVGTTMTEFNDGFEALRKKNIFSNKLHSSVADSVEAGLRTGSKDKSLIKIRSALSKHGDYLKRSGVITGKVKDWLPRLYNAEFMNSAEGAKLWGEVLTKHGIQFSDAMAMRKSIVMRDGFAATGVNNGAGKLTLSAEGKLTSLTTDGEDILTKGSNLLSRVIDIPDSELMPFFKTHENIYDRISTYVHTSTRYAEFSNRFGSDLSKLNKDIMRIDDELKASGKPSLAQHDLDNIYGLADALLFRYKPLTDTPVGRAYGTFNKIITPAVHMLTLPLATINSMSEVIMPLGRAALRPSATFAGMKGLINHIAHSVPRAMGIKSIKKAGDTRAIEELGIGLDVGLMDMMTQIGRGDTSVLSSVFFKAIFLHQWTRAMMVSANETGKAMIKGHLKDIAAGKGNVEAYTKDLMALGVSPSRGAEWIKAGMPMNSKFAQEDIKRGGLKFVSDTVMLPRASQLPIWHSNPRAKPLTLLKSFPTQFGNTVMKNFVNKTIHGTSKERTVIAGTVATATIIAMAADSISQRIRYGEKGNPSRKDWNAGDYVMSGIDKFGGTGLFSVGKSGFMSQEFGKDGSTAILGPVVSIAEDLKSTAYKVYSKGGDAHAVAHQASKLVPFVNVNKNTRDAVASTLEDIMKDKVPNYNDL